MASPVSTVWRSFLFAYLSNTTTCSPRPPRPAAVEAILAALRGGSMQDPASGLPRIHLLGTSVNKEGVSLSARPSSTLYQVVTIARRERAASSPSPRPQAQRSRCPDLSRP